MKEFVESQYTGFYFETTTFLFFLITREEAGGSGEASCVLSALKPALPPQDARPSTTLGAPGATGSES